MKIYKVTYRSRYDPLEGNRSIYVKSMSGKFIRDNWHDIMHTDEYKIVKIEEVKEDV